MEIAARGVTSMGAESNLTQPYMHIDDFSDVQRHKSCKTIHGHCKPTACLPAFSDVVIPCAISCKVGAAACWMVFGNWAPANDCAAPEGNEQTRERGERKAQEKKRGNVMHIIVQDLIPSIWCSEGVQQARADLRARALHHYFPWCSHGTVLAFRNVTNASQSPGWSGLSEARRDGSSWLASAKYVFGETDVHYLLNTARLCGERLESVTLMAVQVFCWKDAIWHQTEIHAATGLAQKTGKWFVKWQ